MIFWVEDGLAYVVSIYDNGVQILNVSNPNNITPLDNIKDSNNLELNGVRSIYVKDKLAYVASTRYNGIHIFNFSNPNNITHLDSIKR